MELQRILCPVDFSDTSRRALATAAQIAGQVRAQLNLVHVYHLPAYALPDGAFIASPDFAVRVQNESHKYLRDMAEPIRAEGLEIVPHVVEGAAAIEIVRLAGELGAHMVVMGTHGRGGLSHVFLGSVAERVIRTSPCPVLTVRR